MMTRGESKRAVAALDDTEQNNQKIPRIERYAALTSLAITCEEQCGERENDEKHERKSSSIVTSPDTIDSVKLRLGEVVFNVEKSTLLRVKHTYFYGMLSSGAWKPEADGAYFIDRPAMGFDRILEYLRSGELSVDGLSGLEEECLYSSLDYLLIPYTRRWKYNTQLVIEGFSAWYVCELKDGRLCGAYKNDIIIGNMDTRAIEIALKGHTNYIHQVIQLEDGRLCSCSRDTTIKLWSIDSELCELTLAGHTDTNCIVQLFDGRLCSGSGDRTTRVWSTSTGICEMTINAQYFVYSLVQLPDGRICCGDSGGNISIYTSLTGECELSLEAHEFDANAIVCIDATRICAGYGDRTIRVWSTATGECERTLEGHADRVTSMVLMQDGRLCSASEDGTLKLWNLETGECEKTLSIGRRGYGHNVIQLNDGRLVSCSSDNIVRIWSYDPSATAARRSNTLRYSRLVQIWS